MTSFLNVKPKKEINKLSINYKVPQAWEKYVLAFVAALVVGFLLIQISFSQIATAQSLEALDMHCREVYHDFCFGDKWSNIVEKLGNDTMNEHKTMDHDITPNSDIYEDQSFMCKHKKHVSSSSSHEIVCIVVNDDDVLSQKGLDETMNQYKNDLDTFSINDILGDPQ